MTTALLIIDGQNAILAGKGTLLNANPSPTLRRMTRSHGLQSLRAEAHRVEAPAVLVQHDGDPGHRLAAGTDGWAIRSELPPAEGDTVVHKKSSDSFLETDLADRLAERNVTHLIVGGCMTQFCVDTTGQACGVAGL